MGFKFISIGERYERDFRRSGFDENNRIELDCVSKYRLDCATPPTSLAKNYEIRNDLYINLKVPKSDYHNENFQKLLAWRKLPVQHDDYYRDVAVTFKMGEDSNHTVLFTHARINKLKFKHATGVLVRRFCVQRSRTNYLTKSCGGAGGFYLSGGFLTLR